MEASVDFSNGEDQFINGQYDIALDAFVSAVRTAVGLSSSPSLVNSSIGHLQNSPVTQSQVIEISLSRIAEIQQSVPNSENDGETIFEKVQ